MTRCGSSGCAVPAPPGGASTADLARRSCPAPAPQQLDLRRPRRRGAAVGQVDDVAPARARRSPHAARRRNWSALGQPVIAAGLPRVAVHALLHHHPLAVVGDDEAVQVEIETVLHRRAVDLGDQAAGAARALRRRGRRARRSPSSSCGVLRECLPRPPQTWMPSSPASGVRPRFSAPMTLVVMPEECQSMPITAPNDWNQNGCARRRSNSSRP